MKRYSIDDVRSAFESVGIARSDTVLVHSALFPLGRMSNEPAQTVPLRFLQLLFDRVGEHGTVAVPTFCWGFCRGELFDRQRTPSEGMGLFAETVRQLPSALRSPHPMQSISATGALAHELCSTDPPSAFSPSGPFQQLLELDATILLLGAPMQSVSLVHLAEQQQNVPYRYFKSFTGPYRDGESVTWPSYEMFVRDLSLDPQLDLSRLEAPLRTSGALREASVGSGRIAAVRVRAFHELVSQSLQNDPLALLGTIRLTTTSARRAA